jgi:hypothetical protein
MLRPTPDFHPTDNPSRAENDAGRQKLPRHRTRIRSPGPSPEDEEEFFYFFVG